MPLDVDKGIELPQLELISTKNDDCTTEYSTGKILSFQNIFKNSPVLKWAIVKIRKG